MPQLRLGVFGGSFNPIHNGHLQITRAALKRHRLHRMLLLPARHPPHKQSDLAAAEHRLEMTRLACEGDSALEVCDIELRREGPSFTADTLEELGRGYPGGTGDQILNRYVHRGFSDPQRPRDLFGRGFHWPQQHVCYGCDDRNCKYFRPGFAIRDHGR